jgi:DNA-binding transcriptional ArsR family regulator
MAPIAPFSSPNNLTEVLRGIIEVRQTGYLKIKDGDHEGCIAVENGVLLYARADSATGLPALFQFVAWREARFEFQERPLRADITRDLAAYDPQVLLTGVVFKVEEQNLLLAAIPALDDIVRYVGGEGLASVEITPSDLMLLSLADGHRTVREIGERTGLGANEAARHLSRFRMAGVIEVVDPRGGGKPARLAATG